MKLLEAQDKEKIFQSQEAGILQQVSTFLIEESTVQPENKDNQKGKVVTPNSSGLILEVLSVPFQELLQEKKKQAASHQKKLQNPKEAGLLTNQQVKKSKYLVY